MPGLARKLLIYAALDGLILQSLPTKGSGPNIKSNSNAVKIEYKSAIIGPAANGSDSRGEEKEWKGKGFEAFGVVGLLTVSPTISYLISITRREQVAQIHGKAIYMITEVALTPLSSQREASVSIVQTANALQGHVDGETSESDSDVDAEEESVANDDVDDDDAPGELGGGRPVLPTKKSSVAEDVMARRGGYGRFAQKWFSKNGWTADRRRNLGLSSGDTDTAEPPKSPSLETMKEPASQEDPDTAAVAGDSQQTEVQKADEGARKASASLLPKLLRTTSLLFGSSGSFFFSYDYDITRNVRSRNSDKHGSGRPLCQEVDPLFFWNRNVIQPFIDAGQYALALPLLQGFVGQKVFNVDLQTTEERGTTEETVVDIADQTATRIGKATQEAAKYAVLDACNRNSNGRGENSETSAMSIADVSQVSDVSPTFTKEDVAHTFLMTLISRRSIERAGLRYLRRGVDDDGNAANCVETEQILSAPDWSAKHPVYSFLQIRGSVPVFFSQSPYSFKPVPQMMHSAERNFTAFKKHFTKLQTRYDNVQVVNLVEKHGNEKLVGGAYEQNMTKLNESGGISGKKVGYEWFDFHAMCRGMKFENVSLLLDTIGPTLDLFGYNVEVNDKLLKRQTGIIRTNCMDCLDRTNVVQSACGRRALELQLREQGIDMSTQGNQSTQWFNNLWADNGDAISKQYASTAALKGDFTRTRKRNYKGALTDMGLSISRFYSGIVNDYFSQAAIDFLVGNVTSLVFSDFESSMDAPDPAISTLRMRQQAIDVSQRLVVADETEELLGGWALLTPHEPNTIKSLPFEESVLLLTNVALYSCRFDWNMEKVSGFERVELSSIRNIKYGTYIINTLSAAQADETTNVGFIITYAAVAGDSIHRVNTRSMSTAVPPEPDSSRADGDLLEGTSTTPPISAPALILKLPTLVGSAAARINNRILALKALPARTAVARTSDGANVGPKMSEVEQVQMICADIERAVHAVRTEAVGAEHRQGPEGEVDAETKPEELVVQGAIISLADAKKSTGLLEQLGHSLKRLVWA